MNKTSFNPTYSAPWAEETGWNLRDTVLTASGRIGLEELDADNNDNTFFI